MARDKEFEQRMQGMVYACRLAQEQGVEALVKTVKQRGVTKVDITASDKQLADMWGALSDNIVLDSDYEANHMATKALKKQIPKKVRYEDVGYEQYGNVNVYACICPSCDLEIIKFDDNDVSEKCESDDVEKMFHSSMVHHAYVGLNNYCNRCGQKLDWSEESEENNETD